MASIKTPQTLVRVGAFKGSLEGAIRSFSEKLLPIPLGLGNTVKYGLFKETEEPYLLMVSQQKDRLVNSAGYNVILTVTSYSEQRSRQVAEQFERETEIDLNLEVPEWLKRNSVMIGMSFQVFEKNPRAAMDVLRGGM
ncbi:MAG: hypothetical protein QW727_01705 [Candidatus Pacearchaeota archaeon]